MMGAAREPDQADFDLDRFINMFDEALTSKDERVVNALRSLMMMVILTKSESHRDMIGDRAEGPLRRMQQDLNNLSRRLYDLEENLRREAAYEQERNSRFAQLTIEKHLMESSRIAMSQSAYDNDTMKNIAKKINSPSLVSGTNAPVAPAGKLYK